MGNSPINFYTRIMPLHRVNGERVLRPLATVSARQYDNRWAYAWAYTTNTRKHGFEPLAKWGLWADTLPDAYRAAARALIHDVSTNRHRDTEHTRLICAWAQSLLHGEQIDLFEEIAA